MTTTALADAAPPAHSQGTTLLLNVAHAIDHMFLLIFGTAVSVIAANESGSP